jgi:hypothetical protein
MENGARNSSVSRFVDADRFYAAIEIVPAFLLFRAELSELVSSAMRFKAKRAMLG